MNKKYLLSIVPIIIGIACLIIHSTNSKVASNGLLEEPFFFLVPISYVLFVIGIISILLISIKSKSQKQI